MFIINYKHAWSFTIMLCGMPDRSRTARRHQPQVHAAMAEIVAAGPDLTVDQVVRWRPRDLRQVIAELRKVVRPTRTELITYTSVVLVFVLVVMTYVSILDLGFGRLVLWAFGGA